MSIQQLNLQGRTKVEIAIERLKMFEPAEGYYLAFSGGKDSEVIKRLAIESEVKFGAYHNLTTVDPPELVYHIRENHLDVIINKPVVTMWRLIEKKMIPPTRIARYCCGALKEGGGEGRFVVTGVRWAESNARKKRSEVEFDVYGSQSKKAIEQRRMFYEGDPDDKRRMIETCPTKGKNILNPIVDWEDSDVWEYIRDRKIKYCKLYDEGFKRLGCVGCPLAGKKRYREFERWPKYRLNYLKAFERLLLNREAKGLETTWKTGEDVMEWWMKQ